MSFYSMSKIPQFISGSEEALEESVQAELNWTRRRAQDTQRSAKLCCGNCHEWTEQGHRQTRENAGEKRYSVRRAEGLHQTHDSGLD